jgi:hypothetical protein
LFHDRSCLRTAGYIRLVRYNDKQEAGVFEAAQSILCSWNNPEFGEV